MFVLAAGATIWTVSVLVAIEKSPLLGDTLAAEQSSLHFARCLMALGLVGLGLLALIRVPTRVSSLFALFSISASLFFAGPPPVTQPVVRKVVWLIYLVVGTMLPPAALLHLVATYPTAMRWMRRRGVVVLLYLPVALGVSLSIWMVVPSSPSLEVSRLALAFHTLQFWVCRIYLAIALALIPARYLLAAPSVRRAAGLDLIALGFLGGLLPWTVAALLEHLVPALSATTATELGVLHLLFVFLPMGLCSALLHSAESDLPGRLSEP